MHLRAVIGIQPNTKERLAKYAVAMWKHARKTKHHGYGRPSDET